MDQFSTSISGQEVVSLLAIVSSYDARTTGPSEVAAWSEAARRGRWTYAEAVEVVHQHFAFDTKGSWLMPGTVTSKIRDARQQRLDREAPDDRDTPGDRKAIPAGDDPYWGRRNSQDLEQVHAAASAVPCVSCGAKSGERCHNKVTGNATKIPHPARLAKAAVR